MKLFILMLGSLVCCTPSTPHRADAAAGSQDASVELCEHICRGCAGLVAAGAILDLSCFQARAGDCDAALDCFH